MKVNEVVFYQSVRLPAPSNRETHRANPSYAETADVEISLIKGCVVLSHKNWQDDCVVGLANVRYLRLAKGLFGAEKVLFDVAPSQEPKAKAVRSKPALKE